MVIGLFPFDEEETLDAMPIPTVERLLHGTRLSIPAPRGETITGKLSEALHQLEREFGGWFAEDLAPHVAFHRSLGSAEERESYRGGGMTISWDEPRDAFYSLAFMAEGWQVQAAGDAGAFHCVFLGRELPAAQAIGEGGHVQPRPIGPLAPVLREAAPRLDLARYRDRSAEHAANVFDVYLEKQGSQIKAGVRLARDGRYFYGARIQVQR